MTNSSPERSDTSQGIMTSGWGFLTTDHCRMSSPRAGCQNVPQPGEQGGVRGVRNDAGGTRDAGHSLQARPLLLQLQHHSGGPHLWAPQALGLRLSLFKRVRGTNMYKSFLITFSLSNTIASIVTRVSLDIKVMLLYLVPAILYCVSNNVFFLSISYFNPTTYAMFLQIRLLLTGLVYQVATRQKQN